MSVVIKNELTGEFLVAYDPDYADGRGLVDWTVDSAAAKVFVDPVDAFELWRAVSTVRPLRLDGRPNRPLTAYTVTVETVEEMSTNPGADD